jgi:hypothetical protein
MYNHWLELKVMELSPYKTTSLHLAHDKESRSKGNLKFLYQVLAELKLRDL